MDGYSGRAQADPVNASVTAYLGSEDSRKVSDGRDMVWVTNGRAQIRRVWRKVKTGKRLSQWRVEGDVWDAPKRCRCSAAATRQRGDLRNLPC